jgi:nitrogenase molybdenum-iron protein alpha/beta subunit
VKALAGFLGMVNFAKEVHASVMSPVVAVRGTRARLLSLRRPRGRKSGGGASVNGTETAPRNACKLCGPSGPASPSKAWKGAVTILHGSQGCATYIRR